MYKSGVDITQVQNEYLCVVGTQPRSLSNSARPLGTALINGANHQIFHVPCTHAYHIMSYHIMFSTPRIEKKDS